MRATLLCSCGLRPLAIQVVNSGSCEYIFADIWWLYLSKECNVFALPSTPGLGIWWLCYMSCGSLCLELFRSNMIVALTMLSSCTCALLPWITSISNACQNSGLPSCGCYILTPLKIVISIMLDALINSIHIPILSALETTVYLVYWYIPCQGL